MSDNLPAPITPEFPPKAAFRKWLRSLPEGQVVAQNWSCSDCPLAEWLQYTGVVDNPYIDPNDPMGAGIWMLDRDFSSKQMMPEWATKFGKAIDILGEQRAGRNAFGPVTAADCLRVLARTPRG